MTNHPNDMMNPPNDMPDYLTQWPGLYVRQGDQIIEAPAQDRAVAQRYPTAHEKGALVDGTRLTLLTEKQTYHINESIRVIHVVEVTKPGHYVYVMGPKPIYGEYLDDQLATKPPPLDEDPLAPSMYSGRVLPSPALDYNYDITVYTFVEPGSHRLQWKMGALQSNVLTLTITINGVRLD